MNKEKIENFTKEMQKETDSNYPEDKETMAFVAGAMWAEFEKRAHGGKRHITTWGKINIENWKRLNDVLMGLFQKGNMNIDFKSEQDMKLRNMTNYFFYHVKNFNEILWNEDDELNFAQGFSLYM